MKSYPILASLALLSIMIYTNLHCAHSPPPKESQAKKAKTVVVKEPRLYTLKDINPELTDIPLASRNVPQPLSVVTLPLKLPFKAVVDQIEKIAPKKIEQGWREFSVKGAKVTARFQAIRDRMKLSYRDGFLITRHTINYHARFKVRIKNPLIKGKWIWVTQGSDWGSSKKPHQLIVTLKTRLTTSKDWRLTAKTEIAEIEHSTAAASDKICVGKAFRFCLSSRSLVSNIRQQIENALEPQLRKAIVQLDRQINQLVTLRKHISTIWRQIQCPLALNKELRPICGETTLPGPFLWLYPEALHMSDITGSEKALSLTLGLSCRPRVLLSAESNQAIKPVPNRSPLPRRFGFHLMVDAEFSFQELSRILQENLKGKKFPSKGDQQMVVEKASIVGFQAMDEGNQSNERRPKLVIRLELGGMIPAVVYITGYLIYEKDGTKIGLADLDYSVETQNLFVHMLDKLNHATFRKELAKYANWDLNRELRQVKQQIQKGLNLKKKNGLLIKGNIASVRPIRFQVTQQSILFAISLKGQLNATWTPVLK